MNTRQSEAQLNRHERRKLRTRRRLQTAVTALLLENGYDALTVQAVTDRADLARGTFYVHFGDKEEAVWSILQENVDALNATFEEVDVDADRHRYQKWRRLFAFVVEEEALLRVLLGESGPVKLARRLQDYIAAVIVRDSAAGRVDDFVDLPIDFVAQFMAGAMLRVITWWLDDPDRYTADEMATMFYEMVLRRPLPDGGR